MFKVAWIVPEAEWTKAKRAAIENGPDSDYDRDGLAFYYLLEGLVAIRSASGSLFEGSEADRYPISLFDLASQLASAPEQLTKTGRAQVTQGDDSLEIYMALKDGLVVLTSNRAKGHLSVPMAEFIEGCNEFLRDLARELSKRAPEFLRWKSIARIAAFAPS